MPEKIAVLLGGRSAEREVSLKTGEAVYKALKTHGYDAVKIDAAGDVWNKLEAEQPDKAFLALHGRYGEDGTVQGLLELMDIPYTGSGVTASAVAIDKKLTKDIFRQRGIPVAADYPPEGPVKYPVIVKPSREGSTIGVTIVKDESGLKDALKEASRFDDSCLIEEFVEGRLLTIAVIGKPPAALPIIEVKAHGGIYDYQAKYTPGMTDYICPAALDPKIAEKLQDMSVLAHDALGCEDVSRVDFILQDNGRFVCLEVNTMPGLTETSLVPKAANAAGLPFEDLVVRILKGAALKLKTRG
ncbi:MAG: D-alanine--D-alanine ligase [Actinomycetota bacterium]